MFLFDTAANTAANGGANQCCPAAPLGGNARDFAAAAGLRFEPSRP